MIALDLEKSADIARLAVNTAPGNVLRPERIKNAR